eukprot:scaffold1481_cov153-Pinguiococcus_pyrenoidosus.AAC.4
MAGLEAHVAFLARSPFMGLFRQEERGVQWCVPGDRMSVFTAKRSRLVGAVFSLVLLGVGGADAALEDVCGGFKVFVYHLPPATFGDFNASRISWDLYDRTASFTDAENFEAPEDGKERARVPGISGMPCDEIRNGKHGSGGAYSPCFSMNNMGMGSVIEPGKKGAVPGLPFFDTSSHVLEWTILKYVHNNCYVDQPDKATLFLLPIPLLMMYKGVRDNVFEKEDIDTYWTNVKEYLRSQASWTRRQGRDHVLVVSKIVDEFWDTNRAGYKTTHFYVSDPFWGNTVFLSSGGRYHERVVNLPYPTFLHPSSDDEQQRWIDYIWTVKRASKAVLAAGWRQQRQVLFEACEDETNLCDLMRVDQNNYQYADTLELYLQYTYTMQPGGDTPTRRGFFDSLICGAIPIIFGSKDARKRADLAGRDVHQYYPKAYARFFGRNSSEHEWINDIALMATDAFDAMRLIRETTPEEIERLRRNINEVIPALLYWDSRQRIDSGSKYGTKNAVARAFREIREHPVVENS